LEKSVEFGVALPSYGPQATRLNILDTALAAESLGFDHVWVPDHLALPKADAERFGHIFEAITTLAYIAGCTRRIGLGVSALVLPQRNPLEVAKQIATLDVLSGGRVTLAVAVGWSAGEYANLGYEFHNRGARMDDAIKVLRTLWRGGRVISYQGPFYRFEQVVFSPPPVQSGGPRLWVAGDSPRALRRAVLLGDGWHPNALAPQALAAALERVRPLLGGRPFDVIVRTRLTFDQPPPAEGYLGGDAEAVIAQLRALQAAGATGVVLTFVAETQAERERALRRFATEVRPAFASHPTTGRADA
jgi:probable F420-dependent oxidoreductase